LKFKGFVASVPTLLKLIVDDIDTTSVYNTNQEEEYPELKKGINLPKTNAEWLTANEHFKFSLMSNPPITMAI
jgi:hypothetical protein